MRALLLALALLVAAPAGAVQPDEILADPALEARARAISEDLRCLVCRNESIDDSNAELARDLRLLVRERLKAGDTDDAVVAYIVDRYGEFVLLKPRFSAENALIWLAGPVVFLVGLGIAVAYLRRRRPAAAAREAPLSDAERRRLEALVKE
jgi:cytochrome c-type biogenesis protein CcmH